MNLFEVLPLSCLTQIFQELDPIDAFSASRVSPRLHVLYQLYHSRNHPQHIALPIITGQVTAPSVSFATTSSSSRSSSHADEDPLASTDTDMSSSPEEDDWEFEMTDEVVRRLSLIPKRDHNSSLPQLPTELQFMIFKELDKIDSCCLGLAHPNLYVVYRAIHGTKMPLNTRRIGPNLLESAWELVGRQECKQCGGYRCELHAHIKTWMPANLEYCAMKQNFGFPARNGAPETCFRGKPSKPRRCGRHPTRTTSVHQDDAHFSIV